MDFVALDLGASCTRMTSIAGKFFTLDNNVTFFTKFTGVEECVDLTPSPVSGVAKDIDDNIEVIIKHDLAPLPKSVIDKYTEIKKQPFRPSYPMHAAMGFLAKRMDSHVESPTISFVKVEQRVNYLSTAVATAIMKYKHSLTSPINLFIVLPPSEARENADLMRANLVGKYEVNFLRYKGGTTVEFEIANVFVYPESVAAITSFAMSINGGVREENREFMDCTILSLDIGASTTDISIVEQNEYLDRSGRTFRTGINAARESVKSAVYGKYNLDIDDIAANTCMVEGRLKNGRNMIDVSEIVNNAKAELAIDIIRRIQSYFSQIHMPITNLDAIVVSGGGSLPSQYVDTDGNVVQTCPPICDHITREIRKIGDGIAVRTHSDTPRMANIQGLYIAACTAYAAAAQEN